MKHPVYALMLVATLVGVSMQSCKKDEKEDAKLNEEFSQFNDDSNIYKEESDDADSKIDEVISNIDAFSGRLSSPTDVLCGATIDSFQIAQKIIFINFDGITPCFTPSRTRHGQIKVQLTSGTYWSDVNAILTITYFNYKVIRLSDNRSITFNGVKTLKNINGNDWWGFFVTGTSSLKYQSRAFNIQVVYDNGATAVWNVARITEWHNISPAPNGFNRYSFKCYGDTTLNGYSTVDMWGVNRYNQNFTTYYTAPWESDTYCDLWRPTSGQLIHDVNNSNFILTLGVDQSGNPSTLDCAYGFKVNWTVNGNTQVVVLSY